ncbi:hypothetical protein ANCDUO_00513 [Ancylostoma duodenale]|uniref:Peptidase M1 membrane alanine aminopeptidase domain-containing protein n=1 Tax=Ancylostoma duodenale TaxID=51022 RepID=A0A0C2E1C2_9BILA|nr:hypothetical protein ANCDUO_00513 [Ancylostoma duodenale]
MHPLKTKQYGVVDFILVPDYDGGMENWGHVLLSENLATYGDDAHLTYVIAHELAHHWIGNKATVDSWRWICLQIFSGLSQTDVESQVQYLDDLILRIRKCINLLGSFHDSENPVMITWSSKVRKITTHHY